MASKKPPSGKARGGFQQVNGVQPGDGASFQDLTTFNDVADRTDSAADENDRREYPGKNRRQRTA